MGFFPHTDFTHTNIYPAFNGPSHTLNDRVRTEHSSPGHGHAHAHPHQGERARRQGTHPATHETHTVHSYPRRFPTHRFTQKPRPLEASRDAVLLLGSSLKDRRLRFPEDTAAPVQPRRSIGSALCVCAVFRLPSPLVRTRKRTRGCWGRGRGAPGPEELAGEGLRSLPGAPGSAPDWAPRLGGSRAWKEPERLVSPSVGGFPGSGLHSPSAPAARPAVTACCRQGLWPGSMDPLGGCACWGSWPPETACLWMFCIFLMHPLKNLG